MGESTYGCRPRARSAALQPRQFPISNVCRTRIPYDRKKREAAGPTCYGSFTYGQSPFAPVPEVLHTKAESAAQQRVYKEFFHVWRGHSQSVCAAGSGSSCTAAVLRDLGVPQAYRPNLAPVSSAFLTSQTAPLTFTQPTELVFKELIPGAPELSRDPPQVQSGDSSGSLGGNIAAASSTSPPVISADLSVDSSAMMSFPATVSVENRGSILPDALNTGDALERYGQVSQKMEALLVKDGKDGEIQVSANPSAVGGCSWRSSSMGMLRYSTRLQPRHYRSSTVRCTTSKKLREAIKKLNAKIFQSDALQKFKESIDSLQQELKNSTNLIFEEQSELSLIHNVQNSRSTSFIEEFDKIMSLEKTCRKNDKLLKDLQTGLLLNFDRTDSLLSKVKKIHARNKDVSKEASKLASQVYDHRGRIDVELSWLCQFSQTTEVFSSKLSAVISEIGDFQNYLLELSDIMVDLASWKHPCQDYDLQLCALRTIFRVWESTDLSIKHSAFLLELAADCCALSKNLRNIFREKTTLAERFHHAELDVEQNGPKLEQTISGLQQEVDKANRLYVKKLSRIPNDNQRSDTSSHIFQNVTGHSDFSWRVRKYNNRNIAPPVRTQGRGECSSMSTVSCTESLYKKQNAARIVLRGQVYRAKEFTIKLSHNHLQDIVAQYFEMKQGEGKNKLAVCLEQMVEKGVLSESAYNNGDAKVEDYHRYRIDGFEEILAAGFEEACDIVEKGNALIGNMLITTDYYRLGPNDVYDIPADAIYETNPSGQKCSHCVVIVGFGTAPDGTGYYVFQNSYGPDWGSGGYGRVSASSLKHLYSPRLGK